MIEILIGGKRVYAGDNVGMNLTKSIFDLLEPDKRKSDFTKTVEIEGTQEADQVFKALYNVNFNISGAAFDPSKRKPATIYINTIPVLEGYCQLTDITILNEGSHVYSVVFYGQNADIFKELQDKKLSDLDWSDPNLNHTWNKANIETSWSAPIGEGYVYPFVNYGYVSTGGLTLQVEEMRPWLYMKEIWDRIFAEAGMTYTSDYIDSDKFKRLIYSCDEPIKRSQSEIAASEVDVDMVTAQTITTNGAVVEFDGVAVGGGVLDWGGAPNYTYTTAISGIYNIGGVLRIRLKIGTTIFSNQITTIFAIQHRRGASVINEQRIKTDHEGSFTTSSTTIEQEFFAEYFCESGDEIRIILVETLAFMFGGIVESFFDTATAEVEVRPSGATSTKPFLIVRLNETLTAGSTINVGFASAGKLSQKEFILGVLKMFNMRFDPQPDGSILVEPRDDYYIADVIDLTKKLDTSRDFVIKPLDQSKYRKYVFKYKNSKDFFNTNHQNAWVNNWGYSEVTIDNDFANGDKTTELPWSLPVIANSVVSSYANTRKPAAILYNENNQGLYAGNSIPKVLVYGGLTNTFSAFRVASGSFSFQYPYAGIQDSLTDPTFDITFDEQPTYYWQDVNNGQVILAGNGGLYPQFHEREILELTNKNSKIVECFVKLTPYDYYTLSFRKFYFIRDAYYRLYEVQDYNPLSYEPTKLILLKIEEVPKRVVSAIDVVADQVGDNISDGSNDPILVSRSSKFGQFDGVVGIGDRNFVSGNNIIVSGDNNDVQGDNIILLNLSDQVPSSGTINIGFNLVTIDADYTVLGQEGSPIYIHSTALAAITIELLIAHNKGKVVYVSADNPCTVISEATLNDTTVTYGHYYNNGTDWIKFG